MDEQPSRDVLNISIQDALDRALKHNLGIVLSSQDTQAARADRLRALSDLLPKVSAKALTSVQQINLAAYGFPLSPGTRPIVGPFGLVDARATAAVPIVDVRAWKNSQAAAVNVDASSLSAQDAREIVVLVVANLYLDAIASQSRVAAAEAQLRTAGQLHQQAVDLRANGVAAGIDVLRAQVQLQTTRSRLLAAQNALEKGKLALARAIGLAGGQRFALASKMPEAPPFPLPLEQVLASALVNRADYKRAQALLRSAELARAAAAAGRLPAVRFDGDYGSIGRTLAENHGTFTAALSVQVPIFQGGRLRSEIERAGVLVAQRQAELADARGKIDAEVRGAYLDIESATQQLEVARTARELADQQLVQARDRFGAGVAGSLEVTQAEDAVVLANEQVISSLYAFNIAQATLARYAGVAEKKVREFLGER